MTTRKQIAAAKRNRGKALAATMRERRRKRGSVSPGGRIPVLTTLPPVKHVPPNVSPVVRWRLKGIHALCAWISHRSAVRIGSAMDRRLHDLLVNVPGLVNPDWHPTISHGISRRVATFLSPPLRGPVFAPTRLGFDLCIDETCGNPYWRLGEYELGTLGLIRRVLAGGGTFVDVGASVGQMTLYAAMQPSATRVLAFEPHATRFRYLSLGVQRAGLDNVDLFPCALGDVEGTGYLRSDLVSPSMIGASGQSGASAIEVRRLDDVLAEASAGRVDLMKLDVEGAELEVLLGAAELLSSAEAPVVCFEHGVRRHDDAVAKTLGELNDYRLYRFRYGQNADAALVPLDEIAHAHSGENVVACTPAHTAILPEIRQ